MVPVAVVPVGLFFPRFTFLSTKSRRGHQIVVKSEEEGRQHRIAFNSLYLFSLGLLSMKRMERHCIITRVERARQPSSLKEGASRFC